MARHMTKEQKKRVDRKLATVAAVSLDSLEVSLDQKVEKSQTTVFLESQVNLVYKDLARTLLVTVVVFCVLLSIFVYMR